MKTKFWLIALIILATVVLSACTIDVIAVINPDGTGQLGMTYKFTAEDLKSLEGMGMKAEDLCSSVSEGDSGSSDFVFTQEQHGDETWCTGSKPIATLEEMKTEMGGDGFTINTMEISSDKFTFDADADMSQSGTETQGFDMGMINITYSLTAPGKVTNHNGDEVNGNTVTWKLPIGATKNLHLESKVGGSAGVDLGGNVGWIIGLLLCCCCLIVIVIVVVVVVVLMRRKKNADVGVASM